MPIVFSWYRNDASNMFIYERVHRADIFVFQCVHMTRAGGWYRDV